MSFQCAPGEAAANNAWENSATTTRRHDNDGRDVSFQMLRALFVFRAGRDTAAAGSDAIC